MNDKRVLIPVLAGLIGGFGGGFVAYEIGSHGAFAAGEDDQQRIIDAVRNAEPSVVALAVTANGTRVVPKNPLGSLFGIPGGEQLVPFHEQASGSGFVFAKSGLIATDDHVVHGAQKIDIVFKNGDRVPAQIYGEDPETDIALVKVEGYGKLPPPLPLGDSSAVQQGAWTIAIGQPLELKETVTLGVASGANRDETIIGDDGVQHNFKGLMQTSAPINPGNSGGPLLDIDGRVIGINQSVAEPAQGIGFAVPVNTVKTSVAEIEKHPGVYNPPASGFLGVQLISMSPDVRRALHYRGNGAAVLDVIAGSAAAKGGLQPGDVIQTIDGKPIKDATEAIKLVSALRPGEAARLGVWRNGKHATKTIRVGSRPLAS